MNLQGKVTAIGGLDLKILGGIMGGVKTFLFPKENEKDLIHGAGYIMSPIYPYTYLFTL